MILSATNVAFELASLGIAAQSDNGVIIIDGVPVTLGAANARLDAELAAPSPTYPTLAAAKRGMVEWINQLTSGLAFGVPEVELRARARKAEAARAYIEGNASAMTLMILRSEAELTGEDVEVLARKISDNADRDDERDAKIAGLRRWVTKQLEAASDPFEYELILENAKSKANALLDELGLLVRD